jgi:hypothetical protein
LPAFHHSNLDVLYPAPVGKERKESGGVLIWSATTCRAFIMRFVFPMAETESGDKSPHCYVNVKKNVEPWF